MQIIGKKIKLRKFKNSDIEDYIRWMTTDTEWIDWDAPWEEADFNIDEYRKNSQLRLEKNRPLSIYDSREIEILATGDHIGRINSYNIDEHCNYTVEEKNLTIGIDIFSPTHRKKGYATEAWLLHINYLIENGQENIYTQSWSGNYPVLALMKKLGFELINTKKEYEVVKNKKVDGLTFKLNKEKFLEVLRKWESEE
ncbi:MAG: GNAT family N-acetyltransferase [Tissierellia bacterium]|nr:GNAT family N-acetyltransferase [Tissierellia bacterium]